MLYYIKFLFLTSNVLGCLYSTGVQKWDLLAAVCVERRSILTPVPNEIEKNFQEVLSALEFERSYKSDNEIRHSRDM